MGDVAHASWTEHGDALAARGPFDVVLAADVLYTRANVEAALRLLPRLVAPGGESSVWPTPAARARATSSPRRAARSSAATEDVGEVALHTLR